MPSKEGVSGKASLLRDSWWQLIRLFPAAKASARGGPEFGSARAS